MKLLLMLFLAGCAVKCDESNYYVIEMPEDVQTEPKQRHLQVYWNVPTMQCRSKKIPFLNLERFGIMQNTNDSFRGDQIAILYDPGYFPALLRNETSGKLKYRNGGVPQEGDLDLHLRSFKAVLNQSIPDEEFSGIGIIDFESWRPILRQNFGETVPYKSVSYEIEKKRHWWWPPSWIQEEAKQRFEEAAKTFMESTIAVAKQMRPKARWGYYGFPYCFNMANNNMNESCSANVNAENDQIHWLWMESTALYPSVYSSKELSSTQLQQMIRGRVKEAARERKRGTPILPYFWFRYRDGGFLTETDLHIALKTFNESAASGFIIWGGSSDVNTVEKCHKLLNYVEKVFGPAIAKYTKNTFVNHDEVIIDTTTISTATTLSSRFSDITESDSADSDLTTSTDSSYIVNDTSTTSLPTTSRDELTTHKSNIHTTSVWLEESISNNNTESDDFSDEDITNSSGNITESKPQTFNISSLIDIVLNKLFVNTTEQNETVSANINEWENVSESENGIKGAPCEKTTSDFFATNISYYATTEVDTAFESNDTLGEKFKDFLSTNAPITTNIPINTNVPSFETAKTTLNILPSETTKDFTEIAFFTNKTELNINDIAKNTKKNQNSFRTIKPSTSYTAEVTNNDDMAKSDVVTPAVCKDTKEIAWDTKTTENPLEVSTHFSTLGVLGIEVIQTITDIPKEPKEPQNTGNNINSTMESIYKLNVDTSTIISDKITQIQIENSSTNKPMFTTAETSTEIFKENITEATTYLKKHLPFEKLSTNLWGDFKTTDRDSDKSSENDAQVTTESNKIYFNRDTFFRPNEKGIYTTERLISNNEEVSTKHTYTETTTKDIIDYTKETFDQEETIASSISSSPESLTSSATNNQVVIHVL